LFKKCRLKKRDMRVTDAQNFNPLSDTHQSNNMSCILPLPIFFCATYINQKKAIRQKIEYSNKLNVK
jgi:hypothetical protein